MYSVELVAITAEACEKMVSVLESGFKGRCGDEGDRVTMSVQMKVLPKRGELLEIRGETFLVDQIKYHLLLSDISQKHLPVNIAEVEIYLKAPDK